MTDPAADERYRQLFEAMDEGFCIIEFLDGPHGPLSDYVHVEANPAYERNAGIPNVVGRRLREMVKDEADGWVELYGSVLRTGDPIRFERELVATGRHLQVSAFRLGPPENRQVAVLFNDVTDRRQAEQALRQLNETLEARIGSALAEQEQAEQALRQAQKMEAVGQLTGGIAHDFNNMLTGVIGAMDIIKRRLAAGRTDDIERFMDAASASAQRAAALTARLLAFSRRQSLDPQPLDIDELATSLEELLRRSIHENIKLRIIGAPGLPRAIADANQLENALLNLVINARDAMPDGGQLTIETSAVDLDQAYAVAKPGIRPGRYVMIAVSDTGVGMTPDVVERVFEPFFSTKPLGQGTGLGLSMIYGFARQSGGQVRIHSQPGVGTSVKLYLPVAPDEATTVDEALSSITHEGDGQTVLLVEDDPSVRLLVRAVLEELSYHTIEAADADSALPAIRSADRIDLMISDVGLPGMSGRELADIAREHRPELPILFITGYAENAAIRAGFLGTGMRMITKPFAIESLSAKIAEMMSAGR